MDAGDEAVEDFGADAGAQGVIHRSTRADRAHAAGVRSLVAVVGFFVVAAIGEKKIGGAIHKSVDRAFDTFEEFLDHDAPSGLAKSTVFHAEAQGGVRF